MAQAIRIAPQTDLHGGRIRVAAYCRVSSNSADQQNSYARQISVYKTMIEKRKDWELVEIFADEGITGTKADKRPDFLRMIRMCELRKIDLIVTKSVSRFARNVKDALEYVRKLKRLGVGVMFEKEGISTQSMADEMLLNTFAAIAEEESVSISQNLKLANRKRMEKGDYINASVPFGFERKDKKLIPLEPEAEIVRWIYESYLQGSSTAAIASELNACGVPTKSGSAKWSGFRIARIIENEKNVGDSMFQKSYTSGFPFKKRKNRGEEDKYYSENTHEAIISREIFEAAQKLLEKQRLQNARKTDITVYPFTGKIRCAKCGSVIRRKVIKGRERWCCGLHIEDSGKCSAHYVQTERLEGGFIAIVNNLRFGGNILDNAVGYLTKAIRKIRMSDAASVGISKEITELNGQLLMLEQLNGKNYIAPEVYQSKVREINKRLNELKIGKPLAAGAKLEETLKELKRLKERIEEIEEPLTTFDEGLFGEIVKSGTLSANDELTLEFIGGVRFTEHI